MTQKCESGLPHEESIRNGVLVWEIPEASKMNVNRKWTWKDHSQVEQCHVEFHTYREAKSNA